MAKETIIEELGTSGSDFIKPTQDILEVSIGGELANQGLMPGDGDEIEAPNSIVDSLIPELESYLAENSESEDPQLTINKVRIALLKLNIDLGDIQELSGRLQIDLVPDNSTVETLIAKDEEALIIEGITKFRGLNQEAALTLIENRQGRVVGEHLGQFRELDHSAIALALIEGGQGWVVAEHLDKFNGLDPKVARAFIKNGQVEIVIQHIKLLNISMGELFKAII